MRTIAFFHRAASSLLFIWLGSGPWLAASEKTAVTSGPPSGQATISIDVTDQPAVVFDWWGIWGEAEARIVTIQERHIGYGDLKHSQLNVEYNVPQDSAPKRYFRKQTITNSWAADFFYYSAQTIQGSMTLAARVNDIGETEVVQGQMNDERTNRWMDVQGENMYGPFGPEYTARWTRSGTPRSGFAQRLPVFDGTTTYNDGQPGSADQTSSLADANPTPFWAMGGVGWAFWGGDYMGHSGENLSLDSPFAAQPAEWTLTRAMWNSTGAGAYGAVTSAQFSYSLALSEEDTLADVQARLDADRQAGTFGNIPWGTDRWISYGGNKIVDHSTFDGSSVWLYNYHSDFASSGEVYEQAAQVRIAVPEELRLTGVAYRARFIQYFYDDLDPTETAQVKKIFEIELKEGQWESLAITPVIPAEDGLTVIEFFSLMAEPINPHPILPQPPSANPAADTAPQEYATIRPEIIQQGIADGHGARAVLEGSTTLQQIHLSDSWGSSSDWPSATATWSIVPGATAQVRLWRWTDDGSMLGAWSQVSPSENLMPYFDSSSDYLFAEALGFGRATVRITIAVNGQTVQDDIDVRTATAELAVDADRDGNITLSNQNPTDQTAVTTPFRFWINDDDDDGDEANQTALGGNSDEPGKLSGWFEFDGRTPDHAKTGVDGRCDLIDFFPVYLDIKQLLIVLPPTMTGIAYKLKQAGSGLNFVYTNLTRDQAFDYLTKEDAVYGTGMNKLPHLAETAAITAEGISLSVTFLDKIKSGTDKGIILVEGTKAIDKPLRLIVEKDGSEIAEVSLNIKISEVEKMYRWINLRGVAGQSEIRPTNTGEPVNFPDNRTNGKMFIWLHGYNVNEQQSRAWNAEAFKRLYQSGSRAMFTAVTWHGDHSQIPLIGVSPDYWENINNAFKTSVVLPAAVNALPGLSKIIVGHSMGNIVVASAIKDHSLDVTKYFMLNAAVALEAFDTNAMSIDAMRPSAWAGYDPRLWATDWHKLSLFPQEDGRRELTWLNRFGDIPNAINFYSSGEEVLNNNDEASGGTPGQVPAVGGERAWVLQEMVKGTQHVGAVLTFDSQGGWGFNGHWDIEESPTTYRRRDSNEANTLTNDELKVQPFFRRFQNTALLGTNGGTTASEYLVRADTLGTAIPALSFAAGRNPIPRFGQTRNVNLMTKQDGWPQARLNDNDKKDRWFHSDAKNIAYRYNYKLWEDWVIIGDLK